MPAIKLKFDISLVKDDSVKQQEEEVIMCEYLQNTTQLMHLSSERETIQFAERQINRIKLSAFCDSEEAFEYPRT